MPRGDRGKQPKVIVGLGLVAATILCCLIVGVLAYSQGRETERRYQSPRYHSERAEHDARDACAGREPTDVSDCIYERIKSAEEGARTEQDLTAQQRAASSALVAAIVGVITLIVSGAGLWALLKTIDQGKMGLKRAAQANKIAQRASKMEQRAWIKFEIEVRHGPLKDSEGRRYFGFKGKIINFGNTPALRVNYWANIVFSEPDAFLKDQVVFDRANAYPYPGTAIFPDADYPYSTRVFFNEPEGSRVQTVYLVFIVQYKTVYDDALHLTAQVFRIADTHRFFREDLDLDQVIKETGRLEATPLEDSIIYIE